MSGTSAGASTGQRSAVTQLRDIAAAAGGATLAATPPGTRRRAARNKVGSVGWGLSRLAHTINRCLPKPAKEKQADPESTSAPQSGSESKSTPKSKSTSRSKSASKSKPVGERFDPSGATKALELLFKIHGVLDARRDSAPADALGNLTPEQKRARARALVRQLGFVAERDNEDR